MQNSSTVKWFIIIAIVVITNMLLNYSMSIVFDKPDFESVCQAEELLQEYDNENTCTEKGGVWETQFIEELEAEISYCNFYEKCESEFEFILADYEQRVFLVLTGIGVAILVMAMFIKIPTLSIAFSLTAFVDFAFATVRYWEYSDELVRVGILFVTLLVLIFIAITRYRHLQDEKIRSQGN
jgi:hypothetical protein